MTKRHTHIPPKTLFTWFLLLGFILLLCPHTMTSQLQFAFTRTFQVPLEFGRRIPLAAQTTSATAMVSQEHYDQLAREKQRLENYLATIKTQLQQEKQKVDRLTGLRQTDDWEKMHFIPAFAVADIGHHQLLLDRGTNDHLLNGQFVIADNAVIGTLAELSGYQARVMLVTHPKSRLPVMIGPSDAQGLLIGTDRPHMRINMVKRSYPVSVGDKVYVQKQPGLLTTPIIVGTITECYPDDRDPLLWTIFVKPALDMSRITNVHVIVVEALLSTP